MRTARWAGIVAPPLFIAVWVVAGILRPGYSFFTGHGSDLATGAGGWLMTANFAVAGLLLAGFGLALVAGRRRVVGVLVAVVGGALLVSAIFPEDLAGAAQTSHGAVHNGAFPLLLLAVVVAAGYSAARGRGGWRLHGVLTAVAVVAGTAIFILVGSDPVDPLYPVGGLIQIALVATAFAWLTALALREGRAGFQ